MIDIGDKADVLELGTPRWYLKTPPYCHTLTETKHIIKFKTCSIQAGDVE